MDDAYQVSHYQTNVLAFKEVAKWLDSLKEMGIYDNTRIIIVSDHGHDLGQFGLVDERGNDLEYLTPLLMVKDFNERGFSVSEDFMTNADVVPFALQGVIQDARNPFTGNVLDGHEKNGNLKFRINPKTDIQPDDNVFYPGDWYSVNGDIYDINNWTYLGNW